jgi:hypothetical protein
VKHGTQCLHPNPIRCSDIDSAQQRNGESHGVNVVVPPTARARVQ